MSTPRAEFGGRRLSDPALGKQLDAMLADDRRENVRRAADREALIAEENERLYLKYIRNFWLRTDEAS